MVQWTVGAIYTIYRSAYHFTKIPFTAIGNRLFANGSKWSIKALRGWAGHSGIHITVNGVNRANGPLDHLQILICRVVPMDRWSDLHHLQICLSFH